jgi:hypothetical protein
MSRRLTDFVCRCGHDHAEHRVRGSRIANPMRSLPLRGVALGSFVSRACAARARTDPAAKVCEQSTPGGAKHWARREHATVNRWAARD